MNYRKIIQIAMITAAIAMMCYGAARGEPAAVSARAENICFECIGLG